MKKRLNDLGLVGLARKAGKLTVGRSATEKALNKGNAKLLIMANNSPPHLMSHFEYLSRERCLPILYVTSKDSLGRQLGRAAVTIVAVCDEEFARGILTKSE